MKSLDREAGSNLGHGCFFLYGYSSVCGGTSFISQGYKSVRVMALAGHQHVATIFKNTCFILQAEESHDSKDKGREKEQAVTGNQNSYVQKNLSLT